ncbi:MAG: nucleoside monophosphate kinase [Nanoarchaeota archaeon]|nr:nucleoside monophosphate kinase [Nanoarchaeota archaeon]
MSLRLVFIGVQGSGKGTQAKVISQKLGIAHICSGDLLRQTEGELKKEVDSYINSGKLVPDELMLRILKERLGREDCQMGFILDGFPRNIEQAKELDKIVKTQGFLDVINIDISDEEARKRMIGRWNCKKCGTAYNIVTEPKPSKEGVCDKCNLPLYQRKDDSSEEAVSKRIETYHSETTPVIKHYNTVKINGEQSIDEVSEDILKAIKMLQMFR